MSKWHIYGTYTAHIEKYQTISNQDKYNNILMLEQEQ